MTPTSPAADVADEAVRAAVEAVVREVQPLRVILFGSRARGDARPDSDIDLLVVVRDDERPLDVMKHLYTHVRGIGLPLDMLAVTQSSLRKHATNPGLVYVEILETGREVYSAEHSS